MVEILCPHCEGEIELDDDASGEFECPLCNGEFEWNIPEENTEIMTTTSNNPVVLTSNIVHGLGALLLIIGLFSNWVVLITDSSYIGPFGIELKFFDLNMSLSWFGMFGEDFGDPILAICGILFMLMVLLAVLMQIIHVALRIVYYLVNTDRMLVSDGSLATITKLRWPTSLGALVFSASGLLLVEVGSIIFLAGEIDSIPRPSIFAILLIIVLVIQVVFMNQERIKQ
jgi:hypothetical protein|tara:strand:- start:1297 stop:1980 length:684 start_codon:yes stop_codon:yes gene_type:complete